MRVVIPETERAKKWDEIKEGECFVWDGDLYMKAEENDGYNAVCLSDGALGTFSDDYRFKLVSAHVVVE